VLEKKACPIVSLKPALLIDGNRLVKQRVDGRDVLIGGSKLVRVERPRQWVSVQQSD
jgi:hypothetical protein